MNYQQSIKQIPISKIHTIIISTMKLHLNSDAAAVATARKVRSVIAATEAKVEQFAYKTGDDLSKVSVFNTLPLLETPEGTFFSSNTIIRYLASAFKKDLYGGQNIFHKSLVDQWLDITTCDFEPAVRGATRHQNGQKIDFGKLMEDVNKFLGFIQKHFAEKKFLVGDALSIADLSLASNVSVIFGVMFGEGQRKKYPNTLNWYLSVVNSNKQVGLAELPKEPHEAFRGGKKGGKEGEKAQKGKDGKQQKGKKEQEKKEEKKDDKKVDSDDLFGDDDNTAPAAPVVKAKVEVKKKEKPAAKSIVVFDVKVYEETTDLNKLFQKVKEITIDGLVWNGEPKIVPVAFGMNKLQVGCVVEDAKVSLEDVFERIEGWEQVQSTDTVSFQKL